MTILKLFRQVCAFTGQTVPKKYIQPRRNRYNHESKCKQQAAGIVCMMFREMVSGYFEEGNLL